MLPVRLQLALRWAAVYLLMVAVCLGPAGVLGATPLAAVSKGCSSASCPCDEHPEDSSEHADGEQVAADHEANPGHEDCSPSDECPDDCPDCRCSVGASLAVIPLSLTSALLTSTSVQLLTPIATPAGGAAVAVFRPPRSVA